MILFSIVGSFLNRVSGGPDQVVESTVVTGPMTVTDHVVLENDQQGGIVVAADDIVIDCNGFSVIGSGESNGITVTNRTGVQIVNCNVKGFQAGIHMTGGSGNVVNATTVSGSVVGILLADTRGSTVSGSSLVGNGTGLVLTAGSADNSITNNLASQNASQGFISLGDAGANNQFSSNTAEGNGGYGFVDASGFSPLGRYQDNLCDSNAATSNPNQLCSLAG